MLRGGIKLPFKLLGIPVKLDHSFLLILPLFAFLIGSQLPAFVSQLRLIGIAVPPADLTGGVTPWLLGAIAALGLFASVVVHELGHALVARLYGVQTNEIRLWFLGGVAQFQELPTRRGAEALVALAGPVTSGLLALLLWLALPLVRASSGATVVVAYLAITNVGLALFNLLPALPLDGGRVLRSVLAIFMPYLRATNVAVALSAGIAIVGGIYGVVSGQLFLVIMAFFVYNAGRAEAQAAYLKDAMEGVRARDLMTPEPLTVEPDMPLSQFARLGEFRRHTGYPVVDADGRLLGFARLDAGRGPSTSAEGREDGEFGARGEGVQGGEGGGGEGGDGGADGARQALGDDATVYDVLQPAEAVGPQESAMETIRRLSESELGRLVVVDDGGRLLGIISKTDVVKLLSAQAAERAGPRGRTR